MDKIFDPAEAEKIRSTCDKKSATVKDVISEKKTVNAPKLYDLTTLQREANRVFGYTAQKTLDYTQSLYEKKLVTYPRTDSQYLSDEMGDTARSVIDAIFATYDFMGDVMFNPAVEKVLNSKKVTDHHAIIPTVQLAKDKLDDLSEGERNTLMLIAQRLLCATAMAARYGYRNLVLGAWGCGAFGHDTETVAGYFYKLFFEERFDEFFDNVAFAILHDEDKINAFRKVFKDKIEDCTGMEKISIDESPAYYEATSGFPICNHTECVSKENIGYVQGIMKSGVPFEAELWENENGKNISVVMPELFTNPGKESNPLTEDNLVGFHNQVEDTHNGVLTIGMVDGGINTELNVTMKCFYPKKMT